MIDLFTLKKLTLLAAHLAAVGIVAGVGVTLARRLIKRADLGPQEAGYLLAGLALLIWAVK